MTCPDCEYHKDRAALWRHEAYKLGGTPLPWDVDEVLAKVAARDEPLLRQALEALENTDKTKLFDLERNAVAALRERLTSNNAPGEPSPFSTKV